MTEQFDLNPIIEVTLGSGLAFMAARYWHKRNEAAQMEKRVRDLEGKLELVNQAIIPFNAAFQAILIKELTHFHTPEMDALMDGLGPPSRLTPAEEGRLAVLLDERMRDMGPQISDGERDAAKILPAVIKRARLEAESLEAAERLKLKLVTIAAVVGVPNVTEVEEVALVKPK